MSSYVLGGTELHHISFFFFFLCGPFFKVVEFVTILFLFCVLWLFLAMRPVGSWLTNQGSNPHPVHQKVNRFLDCLIPLWNSTAFFLVLLLSIQRKGWGTVIRNCFTVWARSKIRTHAHSLPGGSLCLVILYFYRYVEALRAQIQEKMQLYNITLPPLCCCGPDFWDAHPDTCANNCIFYKNHKGKYH